MSRRLKLFVMALGSFAIGATIVHLLMSTSIRIVDENAAKAAKSQELKAKIVGGIAVSDEYSGQVIAITPHCQIRKIEVETGTLYLAEGYNRLSITHVSK